MHTKLAPALKDTATGQEAAELVRSCVHCGFCLATCTTYQHLGNELDSPRGRIYLIKQVLEGATPTRQTQAHLDQCLTCRACETTCPSGVKYSQLLDVGRRLVDEQVPRTGSDRVLRSALKFGLTSPLFAGAMRLAQGVRSVLPERLRSHIPLRKDPGRWPVATHPRKMLLFAGCVQPAMAPNINAATARVLDKLGIETVVAGKAGCCGAIAHHLSDPERALDQARRTIDAWWSHIEAGAEAIVVNASGCGAMIHEYGRLLRHDEAYALKAQRVSDLACDVAEVIARESGRLQSEFRGASRERVVFHPPCTLQHGLRIRGVVEKLLAASGAEVLPYADAHLCCGSAGTYSVLEPELAAAFRSAKLASLTAPGTERILSANIGCITHLAAASPVPVSHWIEWLDERMGASS